VKPIEAEIERAKEQQKVNRTFLLINAGFLQFFKSRLPNRVISIAQLDNLPLFLSSSERQLAWRDLVDRETAREIAVSVCQVETSLLPVEKCVNCGEIKSLRFSFSSKQAAWLYGPTSYSADLCSFPR
jgi:hypothetical protein